MRFVFGLLIYLAILYFGATFKQEIEGSNSFGTFAFFIAFLGGCYANCIMLLRGKKS